MVVRFAGTYAPLEIIGSDEWNVTARSEAVQGSEAHAIHLCYIPHKQTPIIMETTNSQRNITIVTFTNFWRKYHEIVNRNKLGREQCEKLWDKQMNKSSHIKAFKNISKDYNLLAYTYLTEQFKLG